MNGTPLQLSPDISNRDFMRLSAVDNAAGILLPNTKPVYAVFCR